MPVGLSLPCVSSPTTMMGASAHAPRHITDSRVNLLSGVVSPSLMSSWLVTSSVICVAPGHVAGGAVADLDEILADGLEPELREERRNAVDLAQLVAGANGDLAHDLLVEVSVGVLGLLKREG